MEMNMKNINIKRNDIIPIINSAWSKSFACVENNLKAIRDRGWAPLSRKLLQHPEILSSKRMAEEEEATATMGTTISSKSILSDLSFDDNSVDPKPNEIHISSHKYSESNNAIHCNGKEPIQESNGYATKLDHDDSIPPPLAVASIDNATDISSNELRNSPTPSENTDTDLSRHQSKSQPKTNDKQAKSITASNDAKNSSSKLIQSINIKEGFASRVITDIVQYYVNDEACQKNYNKRMNDGQNFRESMKKVKTATAGSLFTRGKVLLDEEVLEHVRSRKKEIQDETDRVIQKAANTYDQRAKFIATKSPPTCHEDIDKMKAVELKHWLQWKKRKGDPAMPSKLADMRKRFKEIYERPDQSKKDYLQMMGYDINSLTIHDSGNNSVHKDVKSVSNNEEEVDETDEVLGVLV